MPNIAPSTPGTASRRLRRVPRDFVAVASQPAVVGHPTAVALPRQEAPRRRSAHRSQSLRTAAVIAWDYASMVALVAVVGAGNAPAHGAWLKLLPLWYGAIGLGTLAVFGGYRAPSRLPGGEIIRSGRLFTAAAMAGWLASLIQSAGPTTPELGRFALISLLAPAVWRLGRSLADTAVGTGPERVIILGTGVVATRAAELALRSTRRLEIVGYVADTWHGAADGHAMLGGIEDLPQILTSHQIDRVLVAFTGRPDAEMIEILRNCDAHGVDVDIVPRLFDYVGLEPTVSALGDLPVIHVGGQHSRRIGQYSKRAFDVLVAGALLACAAPVMLAVALAIRVMEGGPVVYRQRRVGRFGRPFDIYKFRTMRTGSDAEGMTRIAGLRDGSLSLAQAVTALKHENDPRVTTLGRFLRTTSLDELPQFLNVLRGDMSLVGPRPLRPFEVDNLDVWQLVRQDVRPGITGLWQVLGRSHLHWDHRMQLDYSYVRHWSPAADLKILAETVPAVLGRRGAQ